MRTLAEISAQQNTERLLDPSLDDQTAAYNRGMMAGFEQGKEFIQSGMTSAEIAEYTQRDERGYRSHGDDGMDAWQGGYSCALYWVAEQYDWDDEGNPIYREGNIWGEEVGAFHLPNCQWCNDAGCPQCSDAEWYKAEIIIEETGGRMTDPGATAHDIDGHSTPVF